MPDTEFLDPRISPIFVILGLIMFLTRRVNWYRAKIQEESLSLSEEPKGQGQT